ncbi:MAG: UDP-N-acetylenolpyruvoylglucosamine reductase [Actinobacteria bacterium RBG_13_63_9]|nr:MAG: UDP-N-acetylenolpyruvoylglucosamine reductase [Actinobacteria bacterium RBG_13_63_9]
MVSFPSVSRELRALDGVRVAADAPLAPLTTIGTGGKAKLLVTVADAPAVVAALKILETCGIPWSCLGAGSDLLVADAGYAGAVIRLDERLQYIEGLPAAPSGNAQPIIVTVGAATLLAHFAAAAAEAGLAGLEFACAIPGSVGGGVAMNAGAYGRSLADVLEEAELASALGTRWSAAGRLKWEYRRCRLPEGVVVTAARFRLAPDETAAILARHCSILDKRCAVQPQGVRTFGSTFKNPSGGAAGRLLEAAGVKGERRGGAEVSSVHANFVVNRGDASTADVLALMSYMRHRVHETSGVLLEPEVRLLGGSFPWESSADGPRRPPSADG